MTRGNFAYTTAGYDEMTYMLKDTLPVSKHLKNYNGYVQKLTAIVGNMGSKRIIGDSVNYVKEAMTSQRIFSHLVVKEMLGMNGYSTYY